MQPVSEPAVHYMQPLLGMTDRKCNKPRWAQGRRRGQKVVTCKDQGNQRIRSVGTGGSGGTKISGFRKGKRLGGSWNGNIRKFGNAGRSGRTKAIKSKQNGGNKRQSRNKENLYKQSLSTPDSPAPRAHMFKKLASLKTHFKP